METFSLEINEWLQSIQHSKHEVLKKWQLYNEPFSDNRWHGRFKDPPIVGNYSSHKVCLMAPHAVSHYKAGSPKELKLADQFTGGLVLLVAELTGCSVVANSFRSLALLKTPTPIEDWLSSSELITPETCFLDVHGCKDSYGADIIIGTGSGEVLPQQKSMIEFSDKVVTSIPELISGLNVAGLTGSGTRTAVSLMKSTGKPGVLQLEFSRRTRIPSSPDEYPLLLLAYLTSFVNLLSLYY